MTVKKSAVAPAPAEPRCETVCVTGAAGFIASWIVKLLLEKGYFVKGTVRDPEDPKNAHLWELEGAKQRLKLYKADILDYESVKEAIKGSDGVFHTAAALTDDPDRALEPAVKGTENVIKAAIEAKVRRVVFTSTIGAVYLNPNRRTDMIVDETWWSDLEFCKKTKNWYCYGKTLAEQAAWQLAKESGLDLVSVCPPVVLGPMLQPTVSASINHIRKYVNGDTKKYVNSVQSYVHVTDVAKAHILVYETPSASGRYICGESISFHRSEVCKILAKWFPEYPVPTECTDKVSPRAEPYKFSNQKLKKLGMKNYVPPMQCIYETVKSLQDKGCIPTHSPHKRHRKSP